MYNRKKPRGGKPMSVEYELKFKADPDGQQAILESVGGQEARFSMETVYYDTPNGDLSAKNTPCANARKTIPGFAP